MICPKCNNDQTKCKDSRYKDGTVYRRRTCLACGYKFTTIEVSLETYNELQKVKTVILQKIKTAVMNIIEGD